MNTARKLKQRTCKAPECENQFSPFNSLQNWCSPECGAKLAMLRLEKAERKKKLAAKREHLAAKRAFKDKDRSWHRKRAQDTMNKWTRLVRDRTLPCVSCDKPQQFDGFGDPIGRWAASHYKSRGAHPELAFNEFNLHKSCWRCNDMLSGNVGPYRVELINRIGLDKVEWLEGPHEPMKCTIDDFKAIREKYAGLLREAGVKPP